jgi:hypothetical protein
MVFVCCAFIIPEKIRKKAQAKNSFTFILFGCFA